jgi:hypothetical protein
MPYAAKTKVPAERTRSEIEELVRRHGATKFASAWDDVSGRAEIEFAIQGRRIRFAMQMPEADHAQQVRSRWRSLMLAIRAKLESVKTGIETFDEAFLAHVVMKDGRTFGEITLKQLEYATEGK